MTGSISLGTQNISLSGSCTVGGQTGTCSVSGLVNLGSVTIQNGLTAAAQQISYQKYPGGWATKLTPAIASGTTMKAIKTVEANTGSINSADGLIQSIT